VSGWRDVDFDTDFDFDASMVDGGWSGVLGF
jgi:hypothetical protein